MKKTSEVYMNKWQKTSEVLPVENVKVKTLSPDGSEEIMYRIGNLWFVETTYVYYTPVMWKFI